MKPGRIDSATGAVPSLGVLPWGPPASSAGRGRETRNALGLSERVDGRAHRPSRRSHRDAREAERPARMLSSTATA
jgi:hypothetical protein